MTSIALPTDPPVPELIATAALHRAPFDGGHIAWRRFGQGTSLVLLHGGHGCWLHWVRNIQALAAKHEVWVPDLPGYGESDMPREMKFESLVEALLQSLDTLVPRERDMRLAGFSFGGLTASALASQRGHIERLSLFGAAGHGSGRRPKGELLNWRSALEAGDMPRFEALMKHNLLMHMLHDEASVDPLALHLHEYACVHTRFRSRAISRAAKLLEALAGYEGRLSVAWGGHDVTAEPEAALRKLAEFRPGCQTHLIPGAGHWVQYEAADAVNALLLAD